MNIQMQLSGEVGSQILIALQAYRESIVQIESAIQNENWGDINNLQMQRDRNAHAIALIIDSSDVSFRRTRTDQ